MVLFSHQPLTVFAWQFHVISLVNDLLIFYLQTSHVVIQLSISQISIHRGLKTYPCCTLLIICPHFDLTHSLSYNYDNPANGSIKKLWEDTWCRYFAEVWVLMHLSVQYLWGLGIHSLVLTDVHFLFVGKSKGSFNDYMVDPTKDYFTNSGQDMYAFAKTIAKRIHESKT